MDRLALAGLFLAIIAVAGGFVMEGGSLITLLHLPAFLIVVGGTVGAVMLQTPSAQFQQGLKMLPWVFHFERIPLQHTAQRIVNWGAAARTDGFLALEDDALTEQDAFLHRGLTMLVDGVEPTVLQQTLDAELTLEHERLMRGARIFDAMGGYSPTIGIIGAVLGLIQALANISDPQLLGMGIATAFVATIYGVGFANFLFLPIGNKLKSLLDERSQYHELIVEGLVSIAHGENPYNIERKLAAYRLE
jgi:chemotaxis protein MotA